MPIRHDPATGRFMPRSAGAGVRKAKRKFSSVPSRYGNSDPLYGNEYPGLPMISEGKAGHHPQVSGHTLPANRIVPPLGSAARRRFPHGYVSTASKPAPRTGPSAANRRVRDNPFVNTQRPQRGSGTVADLDLNARAAALMERRVREYNAQKQAEFDRLTMVDLPAAGQPRRKRK